MIGREGDATLMQKSAEVETMADYLPIKSKGLLPENEVAKLQTLVHSVIQILQHPDGPSDARKKETEAQLHKAIGRVNATADMIFDTEKKSLIKALTNGALALMAVVSIPLAAQEVVFLLIPMALGYLGFSGTAANFVVGLFRRKPRSSVPPPEPEDTLSA